MKYSPSAAISRDEFEMKSADTWDAFRGTFEVQILSREAAHCDVGEVVRHQIVGLLRWRPDAEAAGYWDWDARCVVDVPLQLHEPAAARVPEVGASLLAARGAGKQHDPEGHVAWAQERQ